MMNPKTELNRHRLREIRKAMRMGPVTQTDVAKLLGTNQQYASLLMRHLVSAREAQVAYKLPADDGRQRVLAYTLTERYLATLEAKQRAYAAEAAAPSAAPAEVIEPTPDLPKQPIQPPTPVREASLLQRLKAWLFGA